VPRVDSSPVDGTSEVNVAYRFEWNPRKASSNQRKHGVTFTDASTVFGDALSILSPDPDHSQDEERYILLGQSADGRTLVVSYAERGPNTRIISARPATRRERKTYEEGL
jgi:hypothetical protein